MMNAIALVLSGLGVGGLLGAFAKAILDKRQLKFSKVFDYKERRYQAMSILMWVAANPSKHELDMLKMRRPELTDMDSLDKELELEYNNAMLYASDKVVQSLDVFLKDKSLENWRAVIRAMKKDLYL